MIRLEGLRKQFGNLGAVNELTFTAEAGDVVAFIGPNGAGKTTTIGLLATLLTPTAGDAFLGGFSIVRAPDKVRKIIGYMPEHFGVYDDMTAREYLDFFAALYGVRGARRHKTVDDVLALTDLGPHRDTLVETLSRGMKQRLCLAKTLVHDPQILLLDEPASGLDPRARIEMRELLKELNAMGKTILISSHILLELADFCNKVALIDHGRLVTFGPMNQLLQSLGTQRRLRVRTLDGSEHAAAVIGAYPNAEIVETQESVIEFRFNGTDEEVSQLMQWLLQQKVRMRSFEEIACDLEDVFMRLTR